MSNKKDENQIQIEGMNINEPEVKKEIIDENEKVKNIVKKVQKLHFLKVNNV